MLGAPMYPTTRRTVQAHALEVPTHPGFIEQRHTSGSRRLTTTITRKSFNNPRNSLERRRLSQRDGPPTIEAQPMRRCPICGCALKIFVIRLIKDAEEKKHRRRGIGMFQKRQGDAAFERTISDVQRAPDNAAFQKIMHEIANSYGLAHVVFHALRIPGVGSHHLVGTTCATGWPSYYLSKKYFLIDPIVKQVRHGLLPFDWAMIDKNSSPAVRMFFADAATSGIGPHALTIPIHGAYGDSSIFSIMSNASEAEWVARQPIYLRDMQMIGLYIHARFMELQGVREVDRPPLSEREKECLKWAADGKTIGETATILTISSSSVRIYLDAARRKLDSHTKSQASRS